MRRRLPPARGPLHAALLTLTILSGAIGTHAVSPTLLVGVAFADGARPGAATPIEREQAQTRFLRAKELYDAKDFAKAEVEFRASLDLVNSPNARFLMARCLRELGRPVEAYAELGRTVSEAREGAHEDGRYVQTAEEASAERDALAKELAFITLTVARPGASTVVRVSGVDLKRPAWTEPIPVAPGELEIVVSTPERAPVSQKLSVVAGERKTVDLDAGPEPPPKKEVILREPPKEEAPTSLRPFAYIVGGIGVAGLATFAIAGSMARSTHSELDDACKGGPCPESYRDTITRGRREQTIANVGIIVGGVGLVGGLSLFLISKPSPKNPQPTALSITPNGVSLGGSL
ncbi:MAG: hypothetical protein JWM74_237 [Myxococcaceae bacterium]|nr:hypothetical protein [Myxococcaceae bacterium]